MINWRGKTYLNGSILDIGEENMKALQILSSIKKVLVIINEKIKK